MNCLIWYLRRLVVSIQCFREQTGSIAQVGRFHGPCNACRVESYTFASRCKSDLGCRRSYHNMTGWPSFWALCLVGCRSFLVFRWHQHPFPYIWSSCQMCWLYLSLVKLSSKILLGQSLLGKCLEKILERLLGWKLIKEKELLHLIWCLCSQRFERSWWEIQCHRLPRRRCFLAFQCFED